MFDHTATFLTMKRDRVPAHLVEAVRALYKIRGVTSGVNNLLQLWKISELAERLEIEEALQIACNEELAATLHKEEMLS